MNRIAAAGRQVVQINIYNSIGQLVRSLVNVGATLVGKLKAGSFGRLKRNEYCFSSSVNQP